MDQRLVAQRYVADGLGGYKTSQEIPMKAVLKQQLCALGAPLEHPNPD
jgi:hypothetical protein